MPTCPDCGNDRYKCFKDGIQHILFLNLKPLGSLCNFRLYQCGKCKTVFIEEEDCEPDPGFLVPPKVSPPIPRIPPPTNPSSILTVKEK